MQLAELEGLIKTRRSIRKWQTKPVPEDMLTKAIELATWAANGGNQQPWRFYVITNKSKLKAIADAVQAASDLIASWPESKAQNAPPPARQAGFFVAAPAAIAVAAARYQAPVDQVLETRESFDPRAAAMRKARNTADSRIQSVASAVSLLTVVLHQMGLGAVWMTAPVQAKAEIEKTLNVPSGLDIVVYMPVGYPDEKPETRGRKLFKEIGEIVK